MIRRTLSLLGALLVVFHAWLLADQAWRGELADPLVLARWALAGGIATAVFSLRRRGVSLLWGRKAVAVWSLAALLHGPAIAHRVADGDVAGLPEIVATLTEATIAAAIAIGLGVLAVASHRRRSEYVRPLFAVTRIPLRIVAPGATLLLAPRPPPLA